MDYLFTESQDVICCGRTRRMSPGMWISHCEESENHHIVLRKPKDGYKYISISCYSPTAYALIDAKTKKFTCPLCARKHEISNTETQLVNEVIVFKTTPIGPEEKDKFTIWQKVLNRTSELQERNEYLMRELKRDREHQKAWSNRVQEKYELLKKELEKMRNQKMELEKANEDLLEQNNGINEVDKVKEEVKKLKIQMDEVKENNKVLKKELEQLGMAKDELEGTITDILEKNILLRKRLRDTTVAKQEVEDKLKEKDAVLEETKKEAEKHRNEAEVQIKELQKQKDETRESLNRQVCDAYELKRINSLLTKKLENYQAELDEETLEIMQNNVSLEKVLEKTTKEIKEVKEQNKELKKELKSRSGKRKSLTTNDKNQKRPRMDVSIKYNTRSRSENGRLLERNAHLEKTLAEEQELLKSLMKEHEKISASLRLMMSKRLDRKNAKN